MTTKPNPETIVQTAIKLLMVSHDFTATPKTTVAELQKAGMDSLDQVELIMEMEEELSIEIDDNEFESMMDQPNLTLAEIAERVSKMQPN